MLNPQQEKVVRHHGKPLLVVAGAGSGKTKTLAHKVEFLLEKLGLPEESVLCITFTNKAAKEIGDRVYKVTGRELPWVGTFHSVAYRLLKGKAGYEFNVADESDTKSILKELLKEFGINQEDYDKVRRAISRVKEDLGDIKSEELRELFGLYQQELRKNGLFDFGDLMYELYNLLKENDHFRENLRNSFRFILVDEYQDTNTVQYEILKLIAGKDICVVGDPNQCIYEWRFARPDNIIRFMDEFNPDVIKLETNYRSKGYILSVANAILKKSNALWKELIPTLSPVHDMGEKPVVKRFDNEQEEALWVAREIKELLKIYQPADIAVLLRVSYVTDVFESTFFKVGIPYRVVGALRFYERPEVKNLLYVLRFLENPADEPAFRRVVAYLLEGFGDKTIERAKELFKGSWIESLEVLSERVSPSKASKLREFTSFLRELEAEKENYPNILKRLLEETPFLENVLKRHKGDLQERTENVLELIKTATEKFEEGSSLEDFLSEAFLISSEESRQNAVNLMTIHAAKGLEFGAVFLPRLEEEILPHRSAFEDSSELEEERRLFYVAVTRAKEKLYLSYTKSKGRKPSRFLSDVPKALLNLEHFKRKKPLVSYRVELKPNESVRVGTLVNHKVFGVGKVIGIEGERAQVDFKGKIKTIHTSFLEALD
ncbi:DNA helicase-2/ATP-dependent DNA helicase PcrA [Hydrogenivirga caldilitoris]|uniref:DNA 3'-5' helicase n=1 Tax=Hydrogenivirga caldilitoris TaxID=246264 RepID=A0A497XP22_9AQUI|nr:ATP-dependent helicase [Hydrogenivirga caldilitoris]RLJ70011.1 DNA helicase-2/ATP-dependent DNA helicase PcrA [Hydrogenivirga caldilitoris]